MPSVLVAMSGGVDSSVAACLLKEQGYEVVGSHMRLVHLDGVEHGCCGPSARRDAEAVAHIGGFPFEVADMSDLFEREVIGSFVDEHAAGRTPNPCATCNGQIKFGAFVTRAQMLGIDFVATGHYVRTQRTDDSHWHLMRGADRSKDQSYMLYMLGQRELARSLFPVGDLPKARTRELAASFGLPVATKPDSQELCFAPAGDAGGYLRTVAPALMREGEVVDTSGRVVGRHGGSAALTIGQRRGTGVSLPEPSYVVDIDARANRVVVGPADLLARTGLIADRMTWVSSDAPAAPFESDVRIRYRGGDVPALVTPGPGATARVEFSEPQRAVAPGQSVVIYSGEELLGGGRIVRALS